MAELRLNGVPTGGKIYEVKPPAGGNLLDVKRKGEKDGLDQVYFEANGKTYVAEGDGLELSGLKEGVFQTVEFVEAPGTPQEKASLGTLRVVDDEVNTAWEGVKSVSKASAFLLTGGLIGGGALTGKAIIGMKPVIGHVNQGMAALQGGMQAVKAGMTPLNQGMELSMGAVQKLIGTPQQSGGLIDKIFGGVEKVTGLPQRVQEVNTGMALIKDGAAKAQNGLLQTEQGMAHFNATTEVARQGAVTLKQAAKVAGIGLAVAGTVAIGGAIYGAARGSDENALGDAKGPEVK